MAKLIEELNEEIDKMVGTKKPFTLRMVYHDMITLDGLAHIYKTDRQKLIDLAVKRLIKDLQG